MRESVLAPEDNVDARTRQNVFSIYRHGKDAQDHASAEHADEL
jgi:hypothetical protein